MTVGEFVEKLKELPQDAKIVVAPSDAEGVCEWWRFPSVVVFDPDDEYPNGAVEIIAGV